MAKKPTFSELVEESINKMNTPHTNNGGTTTPPANPSPKTEPPTNTQPSPSLPGNFFDVLGRGVVEPGGRMTLLPVEDRRPLPERSAGRTSQLEMMIELCPETYVELLLNIKNGSFYHVAAEAIGISSSTFYNWLKQGKADIGCGVDSVYNRLLRDVRRAAAMARQRAEVSIAGSDTRRWLSHGPGRSLGNHWAEQTGKGNQSSELEQSSDPIGELVSDVPTLQLEHSPSSDSDESTSFNNGTMTFNMDAETELAVIEAEESAGIFKYREEYKEQLRLKIKADKKQIKNEQP